MIYFEPSCDLLKWISSRRAAFSCLSACLACSTTLGCELLLGIEERPAATRPAPDAVAEAVEDAGTPRKECLLPERPDADVSDADVPDANQMIAFALYSITYGKPGGSTWDSLGFDIDKWNVTQQTDPVYYQCTYPGPDDPPSYWFDNDCGRDNALGGWIWNVLGLLNPEVGDAMDEQISAYQKGDRGLLLALFDYNWKPNDDKVFISVYGATGVVNGPSNNPKNGPKWDGKDQWTVSRDSVYADDKGAPRFLDDSAYVSNGQLVSHFAEIPMPLWLNSGQQRTSASIFRATISAKLVNDSGTWELREGRLGGAMRADSLLGFACLLDPDYVNYTRNEICSARDVTADEKDKGRPCDALSLGVGFEARQAQIGMVGEPPEEFKCDASVLCDEPADR